MRCPLDVPHLNHQAALRAVNFRILILLSAAAVFSTGAATAGKGAPPTKNRRLLDNIFTTKDDLQTAVQAYNVDVASAEATYGPIADWNVSAISDMSRLFWFLRNFNADISSWDTSGVTKMNGMFYLALAINQPMSFETSGVTDMYDMFAYASAFNQPLNFDTSNVKSMYDMFVVRSACALRRALPVHMPILRRLPHALPLPRACISPRIVCPPSNSAERKLLVRHQQAAHSSRVGGHPGLRLCWLWLELGSGDLPGHIHEHGSPESDGVQHLSPATHWRGK